MNTVEIRQNHSVCFDQSVLERKLRLKLDRLKCLYKRFNEVNLTLSVNNNSTWTPAVAVLFCTCSY